MAFSLRLVPPRPATDDALTHTGSSAALRPAPLPSHGPIPFTFPPRPDLHYFLHNHGVKRVKVLKTAGLRHATEVDWQDADAVHALYLVTQSFMSQTLHSDSEAASDDDASDEQPSLVDSDSDDSEA
jgi:hypothetical protein